MRILPSKLQASLGRVLANARRGRRGRRGRLTQRGMTLLEIMIVLAILALIMGLVVGPKVMKLFSKSKEDIVAATVRKYASEAFPLWSQANPDKACPPSIEALNEYMNNKENKDAWGQPYRLLCGANLPAGAQGIAIASNGPDQKENTADDLKSW
ncbi:MAG TPA: prepilin-type N-terminal cleavage/methylation domain-containing protein [Kofleriaceae bacterium]|jgi:general secretion pathway protein G|nr:prepilin-type N-terminal cleavage/methylation domain-containing protein [Kofleriaceae bacterium]